MTEYVVPVVAGIVVSLINKYILNNQALETCCVPEAEEAEHASNVSDGSDMSEASGTPSSSRVACECSSKWVVNSI